jgi:5-methylcytosine-specific restriction protein B
MIEGAGSDRGLLRVCTFHPAYGYEDFIEGYRPREGSGGSLLFQKTDGIFKQLCADANQQPDKQFYLVIDEINRGDIPRIFGELLTLLEKDKRGQPVHLPVSDERFSVPRNIQIIGTMNTADRSIALLDTALRRRFGFIELMPDPAVLGDAVVAESIPLGPWLAALNDRIREHIGRDARNLQIGHAYLLQDGRPVTGFEHFVRVLGEDILPLLEEYCYEDYAALARILGGALVDEARQRIRVELLEPGRRDELVQALLSPSPELATSREIVAQPEADGEDSEEEGEEEGATG